MLAFYDNDGVFADHPDTLGRVCRVALLSDSVCNEFGNPYSFTFKEYIEATVGDYRRYLTLTDEGTVYLAEADFEDISEYEKGRM